MKEHVLILLKPDAFQRNLIGKILSRFEETGFEICCIESVYATAAKVERHYSHLSKDVVNEICAYFCLSTTPSGKKTPIIAMVMLGESAVSVCRSICGETDCSKAIAGTIRGDFGVDSFEIATSRQKTMRAIRNLVHCSDSEDSFIKEVSIWCPRFRTTSFDLNEKIRFACEYKSGKE